MLEVKVVLAIVASVLDVKPAYEEWDRMHNSKGDRTVDGERAYQIEKGGAHPADMYPCTVTFREDIDQTHIVS